MVSASICTFIHGSGSLSGENGARSGTPVRPMIAHKNGKSIGKSLRKADPAEDGTQADFCISGEVSVLPLALRAQFTHISTSPVSQGLVM